MSILNNLNDLRIRLDDLRIEYSSLFISPPKLIPSNIGIFPEYIIRTKIFPYKEFPENPSEINTFNSRDILNTHDNSYSIIKGYNSKLYFIKLIDCQRTIYRSVDLIIFEIINGLIFNYILELESKSKSRPSARLLPTRQTAREPSARLLPTRQTASETSAREPSARLLPTITSAREPSARLPPSIPSARPDAIEPFARLPPSIPSARPDAREPFAREPSTRQTASETSAKLPPTITPVREPPTSGTSAREPSTREPSARQTAREPAASGTSTRLPPTRQTASETSAREPSARLLPSIPSARPDAREPLQENHLQDKLQVKTSAKLPPTITPVREPPTSGTSARETSAIELSTREPKYKSTLFARIQQPVIQQPVIQQPVIQHKKPEEIEEEIEEEIGEEIEEKKEETIEVKPSKIFKPVFSTFKSSKPTFKLINYDDKISELLNSYDKLYDNSEDFKFTKIANIYIQLNNSNNSTIISKYKPQIWERLETLLGIKKSSTIDDFKSIIDEKKSIIEDNVYIALMITDYKKKYIENKGGSIISNGIRKYIHRFVDASCSYLIRDAFYKKWDYNLDAKTSSSRLRYDTEQPVYIYI